MKSIFSNFRSQHYNTRHFLVNAREKVERIFVGRFQEGVDQVQAVHLLQRKHEQLRTGLQHLGYKLQIAHVRTGGGKALLPGCVNGGEGKHNFLFLIKTSPILV